MPMQSLQPTYPIDARHAMHAAGPAMQAPPQVVAAKAHFIASMNPQLFTLDDPTPSLSFSNETRRSVSPFLSALAIWHAAGSLSFAPFRASGELFPAATTIEPVRPGTGPSSIVKLRHVAVVTFTGSATSTPFGDSAVCKSCESVEVFAAGLSRSA